MEANASQITSLTIVCSAVYLGADQRKHQSSASLAFVRGIHRRPVNSPHKWPVTRKMFPFDDVIMWHTIFWPYAVTRQQLVNKIIIRRKCSIMMTSPNGRFFCVTGPLWGDPPITGGFHSQRSAPEQMLQQTITTPSCSLWRQYNDWPQPFNQNSST